MSRAIPFIVGQQGTADVQQQVNTNKILSSGVDFTGVTHLDVNQWPDTFVPANIRCTVVRVGAAGSPGPTGYAWSAANTQIAHNLGRMPIGWIVVYKDGVCDIIAGTTPNTDQFIYLTINHDTVNTTLLIF